MASDDFSNDDSTGSTTRAVDGGSDSTATSCRSLMMMMACEHSDDDDDDDDTLSFMTSSTSDMNTGGDSSGDAVEGYVWYNDSTSNSSTSLPNVALQASLSATAYLTFTECLVAMFRVRPPHNVDEQTNDPLYPQNTRAFIRAMLPALRYCTGIDGRQPMLFFATLVSWSDVGQCRFFPKRFYGSVDDDDGGGGDGNDNIQVDVHGRVMLTWLVSCDNANVFERIALENFLQQHDALESALPYNMTFTVVPSVDYIYGMLPALSVDILKNMYMPTHTDNSGVNNMYVHLKMTSKLALIRVIRQLVNRRHQHHRRGRSSTT